jgi:hypothetical protein
MLTMGGDWVGLLLLKGNCSLSGCFPFGRGFISALQGCDLRVRQSLCLRLLLVSRIFISLATLYMYGGNDTRDPFLTTFHSLLPVKVTYRNKFTQSQFTVDLISLA